MFDLLAQFSGLGGVLPFLFALVPGLIDFFQQSEASDTVNQSGEEGLALLADAQGGASLPLNFDFGGGNVVNFPGSGLGAAPGAGKPFHAGTDLRPGDTPGTTGITNIDSTGIFNEEETLRADLPEFIPTTQPQIDFSPFQQGTSFETLLEQSGLAGLIERAEGRFPDLSAQRADRLGGLAQQSQRQEELATQSLVSSGNSLEEQADAAQNLQFDIGQSRGRAAGDIESDIEGQRNQQAGILAGLEGLVGQSQAGLATFAAGDQTSRALAELGIVGEQALQAPLLKQGDDQRLDDRAFKLTEAGISDATNRIALFLGISADQIARLNIDNERLIAFANALTGRGIDVPSLSDATGGFIETILAQGQLNRLP